MKNMTKWLIGAFCAFALTTATFADSTVATVKSDDAGKRGIGEWTLTLSGGGNTLTDQNGATSIGGDISVGRTGHLLFPLEAGVRQSVTYADSSTILTTRLYADWTPLTLFDTVDLFVGGNVGAIYGNTSLEWAVAPEGGVRVWVKDDVAVFGRVEAPFTIGSDVSFNNALRYFFGVQVSL